MRTRGPARASKGPSTTTLPTRLLFRAFSDPLRLRILHLLVEENEICVGDLVQILRVPQAKASRHLTYLRRARLVATRKAGLWVYYSIARSTRPLHARLLSCLPICREEMRELAADVRRFRTRRKAGGCCPR